MRRLLAALAALLLAAPAAAQTTPAAPVQPDPAFTERANQLVAVLQGKAVYADYFSTGFQAAVPKEKFDAVTAQLAANGPVERIDRIEQITPWSATLTVRYRDALLTMRLAVEEAPPHKVSGLLVTNVAPFKQKTLGEITTELKGLHGATGFAFARLGEGAPELLVQHNADKPFAVGSAFKLAILAELVRVTNAGERAWDDKIVMDGTPLPGGNYRMVPKGVGVTLRDLATSMISISDNSATDILLRTLGREKVEAMLPVLGVHPDPRNRPYLLTMEMFKLKGLEGGAVGKHYLALDEKGKRAMLAGEVAAADANGLTGLFLDGKPLMIDTLEWFYTPADLVRTMDWLRRNTEGPKGADARAILSKNPGVPLDKAQYSWIGFKGGSEPGVLNLTLLLQGTDGHWYVATASWNDSAAGVDTQQFVMLVSGLARTAHP